MSLSATAKKPEHYSTVLDGEWKVISAQLLNQWNELTADELEDTDHDRHRIALLIEEKYGIEPVMTEIYLKNLERVLPRFH